MNKTLYGVPNERLSRALREELELMGMGDNEARRALQAHPLVDILHAVNTIIQKPHDEQLAAMNRWLRGEPVGSSRELAKSTLSDIKGTLDAQTSKPNRSPRTGSVS